MAVVAAAVAAVVAAAADRDYKFFKGSPSSKGGLFLRLLLETLGFEFSSIRKAAFVAESKNTRAAG